MQEVSKSLVCVVVRGGIEIWLEEDKATQLKTALESQNCPQFVRFNGQFLNKADITGVFDALVMEEKTRLKNGQWKCEFGVWHDRFKKCDGTTCFLETHHEFKNLQIKRDELQKNCSICHGSGYMKKGDFMTLCDCIRDTEIRLLEIKKEAHLKMTDKFFQELPREEQEKACERWQQITEGLKKYTNDQNTPSKNAL